MKFLQLWEDSVPSTKMLPFEYKKAFIGMGNTL